MRSLFSPIPWSLEKFLSFITHWESDDASVERRMLETVSYNFLKDFIQRVAGLIVKSSPHVTYLSVVILQLVWLPMWSLENAEKLSRKTFSTLQRGPGLCPASALITP